MEAVSQNDKETRHCPFCGETIKMLAIKCRYCAEFLNSDPAQMPKEKPLLKKEKENGEEILFEARPSLWALTGSVFRCLIFLVVAGFLIYYPIEKLPIFHPQQQTPESETALEASAQPSSLLSLNQQQLIGLGRYRVIAGFTLACIVLTLLLFKALKLKMTRYEVTTERVEWSRGIFNSKVDNMDIFRVIDFNLRRSFLDRIVGVGTIMLITNDPSGPEFKFEKIRRSRQLYDIIKSISQVADRKAGVIHLE